MTPYNDSLENDAEGEAIQLAAAEWLVRQDQPLTAVEEREFECWLAADPRHAQAHALLQETWHLLDRVPAHRVPLQRRAARPWWWVVGSVAAAAAALAVVFFQGTERHSALPPTQRAATSVGGFESLALADGSVVRLNTASEVSVDFSGPERRVTLLRGEASFEVAKDPARPFIVRVGEIDVRAVGTVFNIRHDARAIEVLVTEGKVRLDEVVSGRSLATAVAIAATTPEAAVAESAAADAVSAARTAGISAATQLLTAGQRATILRPSGATPTPVNASVAAVQPAETARALAWHNRRLEFSNEPLGTIAAEFNRYNRHQLTIDDPELATQRFGGKFSSDDIAALVRLLELNFGVTVERRDNETVLRRGSAGR